ncbi:MAG: hybrid sensor histidine kinase/response regulator [Bacteroidetes bacterium]|nr:hybrid sensor histidine kinase/response regulator [Bacteroidota bacterium]
MGDHTILLVDDEPAIIRTLVSYLAEMEDETVDILTASNGKIAIEVATEKKPDLILMDWNMPEMSGVNALEQLKLQPETRDIPVVMVTSITASEYLAVAFELGAHDYIRKPVDKLELLARLKSLLKLEELKKALKVQNINLKKRKVELEQLNGTKDKFFSIISHDLNDPFITLLGISEILIEDYGELDDLTKVDYLKNIQTASQSAKKLLDNLLQWSQSQTGRMEVKPEKIDLYEFTHSVFNMKKSQAEQKKINLATTFEGDVFVNADENMLKTIFRNLIANSLKYTPDDGTVFVHAEEIGEMVEIIVEDTGIGMASEMIPQLFDITSDHHKKSAAEKGGHGLGLILCKEFVEKMGGKIRAESEIGKGSKFILTLPKAY